MLTSNYKNFNGNDYREVSISGDRGKLANYKGICYPDLAPKKNWWLIWHDNIGKISQEDNNAFYVEEYYKEVLAKLDANCVYQNLKDKIILCYEDPMEFCHRHIFSAWIELLFNENVSEVKNQYYHYYPVKKFEGLDMMLDKIIKENTNNMHGFNSLMALRLFEQSEEILSKSDEFVGNKEKYGELISYASTLKEESIICEEKYNIKHIQGKKLTRIIK